MLVEHDSCSMASRCVFKNSYALATSRWVAWSYSKSLLLSTLDLIFPSCLFVSQVKHAMTMTEKILAKHSDNFGVIPGQNIWTKVDKLMT